MSIGSRPRIILDVARLLGDDISDELWRRGWGLAEQRPDVASRLQWYWPPTDPGMEHGSPWTTPTHINQRPGGWQVEFGAAIAKTAAPPVIHRDSPSLLAELERIECWPMPVSEARRLRALRIVELTKIAARGDGPRPFRLTEPYISRLAGIKDIQRQDHRVNRRKGFDPDSMPRQQSRLAAQKTLVEADAWVSALRTTRAGGRGWGIDGREQRGAA